MHTVRKFLVAAALIAAVAVSVTASVSAASSAAGPVVKLGGTKLGQVLVDAQGKTLYLWAHDRSTISTCNGQCAVYWPPLIAQGKPSAAAGVNANLLGTSRRSDGRMQVTYGGHPLYYFVKDSKPGQASGEGLTGFGGRWDPVSAAGNAVRGGYGAQSAPLEATILSPGVGDKVGTGGTFSVEVSLQARSAQANNLLAGYSASFNDPSKPSFHPGPNAAAPGLVVLLSTTPTIKGTPLQGSKTNLAGVFQINDVSQVKGLTRTVNGWVVTSPGFFGKGVKATLTVYAVAGTAPALITGSEKPISNVVQETFTIAG
jgi:predicted lipoprotein with Yx(FWY)xxD motif